MSTAVPTAEAVHVTLESIAAEADAAREAELAAEVQARSGSETEASSTTEPHSLEPGEDASASKPDPKAAKPVKTKESKTEEPAEGGSLAQLRKRWADGDVEGVLRLVSGEKDLAKLPLQPALRALKDRSRKAIAREAEAGRRQAEVASIAERLEARHRPFVEAQQAWAEGDVERAVKLAFGVDLLEFGKRQVSHLSGRAPADPRFDALSRELKELKEQRQQEQQERQQRQQQEAQAAERQALSETLSEMPAYAHVATKRAFLSEIEAQFKAEHKRSGVLLSVEEAAEKAYDELYGDLEVASAGRGDPVPGRQGKKRSQPAVRAKDAASTTPELKPGTPELLDYWAHQATLEAMSERRNGRAG